MRSHLDGIPPDNVNIPVREFARGWFAAEQLHDDRVARGVSDWYGAAVVVTCRRDRVSIAASTMSSSTARNDRSYGYTHVLPSGASCWHRAGSAWAPMCVMSA
jgi:hypothetical protein